MNNMPLLVFVCVTALSVFALRLPENQPACKIDHFSPRDEAAAATRWQHAMGYVSKHRLTWLDQSALHLHKSLIKSIEEEDVPGWMIETGVAKGGSAMMFTAFKRQDRCLHLYDTFEGLPQPSERDGEDVLNRYKIIQEGKAGKDYYGYMKNLLDFDKHHFNNAGFSPSENNVEFHKGLFNETLEIPVDGAVAYAHLDGDWYDSTMFVLKQVVPKLSRHGIVIVDDALSWSGAHDAFQDYFGVKIEGQPNKHFQKDGFKFELTRGARVYVRRIA